MSFSEFHNIGAEIAAVNTGVAFNSVAGGSKDNAEQAGVIIDRMAHGMPLSMSLVIQTLATLAAAATLGVGYRIEHGESSTLADTANLVSVLPAANVTSTGPAGGGAVSSVTKVDLDLGGAKRYIRINVTTDLSAANTDTAVQASVLIVGGEQVLPSI